jgi:hypothetical protein
MSFVWTDCVLFWNYKCVEKTTKKYKIVFN